MGGGGRKGAGRGASGRRSGAPICGPCIFLTAKSARTFGDQNMGLCTYFRRGVPSTALRASNFSQCMHFLGQWLLWCSPPDHRRRFVCRHGRVGKLPHAAFRKVATEVAAAVRRSSSVHSCTRIIPDTKDVSHHLGPLEAISFENRPLAGCVIKVIRA